MKIAHVCLNGPVTDGWTYQDNLLPKYHVRLGHTVDLIASRYIWDSKGNTVLCDRFDYVDDNGVHIIRIPNILRTTVHSKIRLYKDLYEQLDKSKPDVLFVHGVQFLGIRTIVRYLKRNPDVIVYVDNHADFSNSATNFLSKKILHGILWRYCANKIKPYVKRFYGVLPARVDFLTDVYGIRKEKVELLVMGADDEKVAAAAVPEVRMKIRQKHGLSSEDFVIMTGGKIDAAKAQTLLLMEAVAQIDDPKVKLIVFGSVASELQCRVDTLADGKKVQFIGWVKAEDSYDYFAAADLVVFPGRHSVFWEQVAAQGVPMLVKHWDGTTHVDMGGNVEFLHQDSAKEMEEKLVSIMNQEHYRMMKDTARTASKNFLYSKIAQKSLME